jgi:hypothetical protein
MMKIEIVIEIGRSLKLRQVNVFVFVSLLTQSTLNDRPSGHHLAHLWVLGKEMEQGGKGEKGRKNKLKVGKVEGGQVSKTTPSHHICSLPNPHSLRLPWRGAL